MNRGQNHDSITLTVPSEPQSLAVVRAAVEAVSKLANFDKQACYEVVTAVNEACSNVIQHAHLGQRHLPMTLEFRVTAEGLELRLRDEGARFDFAAVPEFDPTEIRKGGRGAFLIRCFVDDVNSRPLPDGGNELRMFKRAALSP